MEKSMINFFFQPILKSLKRNVILFGKGKHFLSQKNILLMYILL